MRKFVVYTRGDVPSVVEVEGELITGMEDPTIMWLPEGEFKFRITQPDFLYEPKEVKKADGSKATIPVPPIYHSHACHWTMYGAQVRAECMVREGFELALRKHGVSFTEEEVAAKVAQVQKVLLP